MKKLMIAAAIVCAAAMSQAAMFNWSSAGKEFGLAPASVTDNGYYTDISTKVADRLDKCTLTYTLTLFKAGTDNVVGSATGEVGGSKGAISVGDINIAAAEASTTYDYVIAITGTQDSLSAKESAEYDYTNAKISTELTGSVTTESMGNTSLTTDAITGWTVSGVVAAAPVPEPTSGLLLLLGVAGLALRRRRA